VERDDGDEACCVWWKGRSAERIDPNESGM
jgi:hypothetical protein